jgi:3'-5' exoribonuclease
MNENSDTPPQPTSGLAAEVRQEAPRAQTEGRLEKVRKVYVRDLDEGEHVNTVFLVTRKARNVGRSGKTYLSLVLTDKTGDVDARIFDGVDQVESHFGVGDYVLVQGEVITFHGKPQIVISGLEHLDPEPIDRKEFAPQQPHQGANRIVTQIREMVGRVHDPQVKALLLAFLEEPHIAAGLQRSTAKEGQHAHGSALGEHVISVMKLANRIADHYPMVDRDVLLAGAFLHDIGKARDAGAEKGSDAAEEERLIGHPVATAQAIHEKAAQISNFPRHLEQHITHLVLSHLGAPEQGSPKAPMTLEALLLHCIDLMDSRVASWMETARHKAPVEGKPRRRNGPDRRKVGPVASAQEVKHDAQRSEERREHSLPKDVTFKPLEEIAPESPAPAPATAPAEEGASGSEE